MSIFTYLQEALLSELNIPTPQRYFPDGGGGGSFEVYDKKSDETIVVQVDVSINPRTKVLDTEFTVNGSFQSTDRGHGVGVQVIKGVAYVILQAMNHTTADIERIEFSSRENDGKIDASKGNQREKLYRTIAGYVAPQLDGWENFDINRDYEVGVLKKPQSMTEGLLTEVTADDKYAKQYDGKLDREIFDRAVAIDPTGDEGRVGKYVDWLVKKENSVFWLAKPADADIIRELATNLGLFNKFNSKFDVKDRDINNSDVLDFMGTVRSLKREGAFESKKDRKKAEKNLINNETEFVLKTPQYYIVHPKTQKASQYWTMYGGNANGKGSGCSWCTGAKSDTSCLYKSYAPKGTLYIIFDANNRDRKWQMIQSHDGERLPHGNGSYEYKDCNNINFNPHETFEDDDEMMEWLESNEFPESQMAEITAEEIDDTADTLLNYTYISTPEGKERAKEMLIEIVKEKIEQERDYAEEMEEGLQIGWIEDSLRDGVAQLEANLETLQNMYGVDATDDNNIIEVLWAIMYADDDISEFLDSQVDFLSKAKYLPNTQQTIEAYLERSVRREEDYTNDWSSKQILRHVYDWYTTVGDINGDSVESTPSEIGKVLIKKGIDSRLVNTTTDKLEIFDKKQSETRDENPQQTIKFESALRELGLI